MECQQCAHNVIEWFHFLIRSGVNRNQLLFCYCIYLNQLAVDIFSTFFID